MGVILERIKLTDTLNMNVMHGFALPNNFISHDATTHKYRIENCEISVSLHYATIEGTEDNLKQLLKSLEVTYKEQIQNLYDLFMFTVSTSMKYLTDNILLETYRLENNQMRLRLYFEDILNSFGIEDKEITTLLYDIVQKQ